MQKKGEDLEGENKIKQGIIRTRGKVGLAGFGIGIVEPPNGRMYMKEGEVIGRLTNFE